MRLAILLLAVASVFANPFHKGASWEWHSVVDNRGGYSTEILRDTIFAELFDSSFVPESSAVLWRLKVSRDGMADPGVDTALLMTDPDGTDGRWLKASRNAFLFEFRNITGPCWSTCATGLDSMSQSIEDEPGVYLHQLWSDTFGLLSGVTNSGRVRLDLIAKDGQSMKEWGRDNGRRLVLPAVGTSLVWEVDTLYDGLRFGVSTHFDSLYRIQWRFVDRPADSSGWARVRLEQSRLGIRNDPVFVDTLEMRWNSLSGEVIAHTDLFASKMAAGFWLDWMDSITATRRIRSDSTTIRVINSETKSRNWTATSSSGWLDSARFDVLGIGHQTSAGSGSVEVKTLRLLQVDDSVIRQPSFTGIKPAVARRVIGVGDLRSLALRYPSASVVVHDAKGASQTMRLDQLLERQAAPRLGLRWLEVRLPDGSVRRGSLVL